MLCRAGDQPQDDAEVELHGAGAEAHRVGDGAAVDAGHRKPVVEDALFGLRAAAPALLSNLSYASGKTLAWDPVNLAVKG